MGTKIVVGVAALLVALTGGVADAQTYPPLAHVVVVIGGDLAPGGPIEAEAQVFEDGADVSFTIAGTTTTIPLGSATAGSDGVAVLAGTIPASTAPGAYTLSASGIDADGEPRTVTTPITIKALDAGDATVAGITVDRLPASGGGRLPSTGARSTAPLARAGLAALAAGGALVLVAGQRRRRRHAG